MHHVNLLQGTHLDRTSRKLRREQAPGEHSPGRTNEVEEVMDRRRLCIGTNGNQYSTKASRPQYTVCTESL